MAKNIAKTGKILPKTKKNITIMEVCGTHTNAIARFGIKKLLGPKIRLVSGPGCPVCVTSASDIGAISSISLQKNVILCTFADLLRVPGPQGSLEGARASGADVRVVYSPYDAVELARTTEKTVVLCAAGFETTAPLIALCVKKAAELRLKNFYIYPMLKLITPAVDALLKTENNIDAFLLPGHVSLVLGTGPYGFIARKYGKPGVVAGFEEKEILTAIDMILAQILQQNTQKPPKTAKIENAYPPVRAEGNPDALKIMAEVFAPAAAEWRGFGVMPASGLALRKKYQSFDAARKFALPRSPRAAAADKKCLCARVLQGRVEPEKCGYFGKKCTPQRPQGPCMVSSEGACHAAYSYGE